MELAITLISRPLPTLLQINGTTATSISAETVSARFIHEWKGFDQDVLAACSSVDLTPHVALTDDLDENFAVGSKLGLTGRFSKNVCDAVTKALSVTPLSHLRFGDYQTIRPSESAKIPDVVLLTPQHNKILLVGELKPFWTVFLEDYRVDEGQHRLASLQNHLGEVIMYMRNHQLKYSFLSTYRSTVFMRRTDDFRFEISLPIDEKSVNPSLRQCFLAMCVFAVNDTTYTEPPDFRSSLLRAPLGPSFQASTRRSPYRNQVSLREAAPGEVIGPESILYRPDESDLTSLVNCKRTIRASPSRAIYEVMWNGELAIAKCWSEEWHQRYAQETSIYDELDARRPQGYDFFPSILSHGKIQCSSIFPKGYILVMSKVQGEPLTHQWSTLTGSTKEHIRSEIFKAIKVLRTLGAVCIDSGRHNVLYDPKTNAVTMVDFELMQPVEAETVSPDMPEMYAIFRDRCLPS